jgi:GTP-binding protein EngB required for normal cell division
VSDPPGTDAAPDGGTGRGWHAADAVPALQARRTLAQHGLTDAVAMIDLHLQSTSAPPSVVVVGETMRGKSTLVNALTGAMVSPSSATLATTCVISVEPPGQVLPEGRAELVLAGRTELVDLAEAVERLVPVEDWEREQPLAARLAVASRWLPGTVLIDTPGVGGLNSAMGRRARLAARQASALMLVCDSGQPLGAGELQFLREIGEHTEHIVLVLTKIDQNPTGWRTVADADRRLLRQHTPRFAEHPLHPVSAAYALHALSQPPDVADRLAQASGLPALAAAVADLVADQRRLAVGNALRAGAAGLQQAADQLTLQMRAVQDVVVRDDLVAERDRLAQLQRQQRRGKLDLERDLGRARQQCVRYAADRTDEVVAEYSARISKQRRGMSSRVRDEFSAELAAELDVLAADVEAFTRERLAQVVASTFGALAPDHLPDEVQQPGEAGLRVRHRPNYALNPLLDPSLAGTAFMGSKMMSWAGLAGPWGLLAGAAGAGTLLGLNLAFRGARQGQQELAGTLLETSAGVKQDLVSWIDAWIRELRPELHIALEDHLKESMAMVQRTLNDASAAAREQDRTRADRLGQLQREHEALLSRRTAVEARLVAVTGREHSQPLGDPTHVTATHRHLPGDGGDPR